MNESEQDYLLRRWKSLGIDQRLMNRKFLVALALFAIYFATLTLIENFCPTRFRLDGTTIFVLVLYVATWFYFHIYASFLTVVITATLAGRISPATVLAALIVPVIPALPIVVMIVNMRLWNYWRENQVPSGFFSVRRDVLDALCDIHRCRKCGYDLTGNLSGVCPECGKRTSSFDFRPIMNIE